MGNCVSTSANADTALDANTRIERLRSIVAQYNVPAWMVMAARKIEGRMVTFLVDDSSSMNEQEAALLTTNDPLALIPTRWGLVVGMLDMVSDTATTLTNRARVVRLGAQTPRAFTRATRSAVLQDLKRMTPSMDTPLCALLTKLCVVEAEDSAHHIVVMTDGVPTDGSISNIEAILRRKPANVFVTFAMATTDPGVKVAYDNLDGIAGVDVVGNYAVERQQLVTKYPGADKWFNELVYMIKLLIGAVDDRFDDMDTVAKANSTEKEAPTPQW